MAVHPLRPATDRRLGGPLPRQLANQAQTHRKAMACRQRPSLAPLPCGRGATFGISSPFGLLSPSLRQVVCVLLTRLPLDLSGASSQSVSFDLHVLSTPPAFVLSQDQTLLEMEEPACSNYHLLCVRHEWRPPKKLPVAYILL